jgi:exodeoxyribonuclease VII small subunit
VEAIAGRLESDRLELAEALALFERGVGELREVERILRAAELRVERLIAEADGSVTIEPVDG